MSNVIYMCGSDENNPNPEPQAFPVPCEVEWVAYLGPKYVRVNYTAAEWEARTRSDTVFEFLDIQNHNYRTAIRKIMARLTELLDEDQFANIDAIVREIGIEPACEKCGSSDTTRCFGSLKEPCLWTTKAKEVEP